MRDITRVIDGNYCIGCGVCPFVDPAFRMTMNDDGCYQAQQVGAEASEKANFVCPFANPEYNEDVLAARLFKDIPGIHHDSSLGYFQKTYGGHVVEDGFRARGSSGGMVSWLVAKLFEDGLIDAVLHVRPGQDDHADRKVMYAYSVSHSVEELNSGAKSKYYPIELSDVLQYVADHPGRYAIIGIPCFIKAVRRLELQDDVIADRIRYHIGLVCGHLKSTFFALSEAWECGISPQEVQMVDFRHKLPGRSSTDYGVEVTGIKDGKEVSVVRPTRELSTTNWGYGYFKYNACEYCDDVLAETADITCGDAWLPGYDEDDGGNNVIVVRSTAFMELIERHRDELKLDDMSAATVAQSQAGGLRHRREGLSYRLYLKDQESQWRPTKRVKPSNSIPRWRKKVYKERLVLITESFVAFHLALSAGTMEAFKEHMAPYIAKYRKTSNPTYRRVLRKAKKILLGKRK